MVRPAAAEADDGLRGARRSCWRRRPSSACRSSACPRSSAASATSAPRWPASLVAEALAHGDMGLAVAALAPGAVATAIALWGTDEQQATYLPAFTGDDVPAAALALTEPRPLFDPLEPGDHGAAATATASCSTA